MGHRQRSIEHDPDRDDGNDRRWNRNLGDDSDIAESWQHFISPVRRRLMSTAQTLRTRGIFSIYGEQPVYRDNFFVRKTRSITRLGLGAIDRREPDGAMVWSASASLERRRHANPLSSFKARETAHLGATP
jgi:hypothetical protein